MRELSLEQLEMVNGGSCSFEDLAALSALQLTGLGMYLHSRDSRWLIVTGGATLGMFACM